MPLAVLAAAGVVVITGRWWPESLAGVGVIGPYVILLLGAAVSLWFNRGRLFIALASLLLAYTGYQIALISGVSAFPARAMLTVISIFVPLNILIAFVLPERGISYFRNYRWLLLLLIEVIIAAWICGAGHTAISGTAWHALLDTWPLRAPPVPLTGRVLLVAAFALVAYRAWHSRSPLEIGLVGALLAFIIACSGIDAERVFGAFMSAAGGILLIAVMQESHRMAFIDELTGLPGRRALDERLVALAPVYTIAMIDVDHFKQFNDTHGHDVGDQVLKLVGAKLAEVGGGGRSFRYGGEEFSVLFDNREIKEAMPHAEALREAIANYEMTVRTAVRRKEPRDGKDRRTTTNRRRKFSPNFNPDIQEKVLSVTVSIGVATRNKEFNTPQSVIIAADKALYRAKQGGRNRVSK